MAAQVDGDKCTGCGLCCDTCPEVFEMKGEKAAVIATPVPAGKEDSCKAAAANCPVTCIKCE